MTKNCNNVRDELSWIETRVSDYVVWGGAALPLSPAGPASGDGEDANGTESEGDNA
jgi:hypothetical protein